MGLRYYRALIDQGPPGIAYRVVFPDLPGCTSAGNSVQQAAEQAAEALTLHLDGMVEDALDPPEPSAPDAPLPPWLARGTDREVARLLVGVDVPSRAVRVNVTMEETLLRRMDAAAASEGSTRSGYVMQAVRDRLRAETRSVPRAAPLGTADVMRPAPD